jgi:hypothetical protein
MDLDSKITAIEQTISDLQEKKEKGFDGGILATALELIFHSGLQKKEIPEIKIGSLKYKETDELFAIEIGAEGSTHQINLTDEAMYILHDYLDYLKSQDYYTTSEAPLFPGYPNTTKIDRDMKKYASGLTVRDLHKIGATRYFKLKRDQKDSEKESLKAAAQQFRMREENVKKLVEELIPPAAYRKPKKGLSEGEKLLFYFADIMDIRSDQAAKELREDFIKFIDGCVTFQPDQKDQFKNHFSEGLQAQLEQIQKEAEERELLKTRKVQHLSEILKEFPTPKEKPGVEKPETGDLEEYYFGETDRKKE